MENYYNKKSIWKWILLYVLIGAVAYGLIYYFFFAKNSSYNQQAYQTQVQNNSTQTADSSAKVLATADWKTYTDAQYGFEMQYPSDYKYNDTRRLNHEFVIDLSKTTGPHFGLIIYSGEDYRTRFESELELVNQLSKTSDNIMNQTIKTNTLVDKIPAIEYQKKPFGAPVATVFIKDNAEWTFGLIPQMINNSNLTTDVTAEDINVYHKILSTFKFTSAKVSNNGFMYTINDNYPHAKEVLKGNGWMLIMPTSYEVESGTISKTTPIDPQFPEIGYCGSSKDKICTVDFQKGTYKRHLNVQSSSNGWIVVGSE